MERVIAYMETSGRLGGLEGGGSIVRSPGDVNVSRSDRHVSFSEGEHLSLCGSESREISVTVSVSNFGGSVE